MLQINHLSFSYDKSLVLDDISFTIFNGESLAIIGESGCGKSTLLQLIFGLYDANQGSISWKDKLITGPKFNLIPGMPFCKYVSQDFDLMPFVTVSENIGKHLSNFNLKEKEERIYELLKLVGLEKYSSVKAKFLSGGQKQRVSIARALALQPEILLLDEPFSHIDTFKKNELRRNIFSYCKNNGITILIATHDKEDILAFCEKTLVLKDGKMVCFDKTSSTYNSSKNNYVASLFEDISIINGAIFYPHQISIVSHSETEITVTNSYYRGKNYLIIGQDRDNAVYYLEHFDALSIGEKIYIKTLQIPK